MRKFLLNYNLNYFDAFPNLSGEQNIKIITFSTLTVLSIIAIMYISIFICALCLNSKKTIPKPYPFVNTVLAKNSKKKFFNLLLKIIITLTVSYYLRNYLIYLFDLNPKELVDCLLYGVPVALINILLGSCSGELLGQITMSMSGGTVSQWEGEHGGYQGGGGGENQGGVGGENQVGGGVGEGGANQGGGELGGNQGDWGDPNQPAGSRGFPLQINDPLNQALRYTPGGTNQPFARNLASALEHQYKLTLCNEMTRYVLSVDHQIFLTQFLQDKHKEDFKRLMEEGTGNQPNWWTLKNNRAFRESLRNAD